MVVQHIFTASRAFSPRSSTLLQLQVADSQAAEDKPPEKRLGKGCGVSLSVPSLSFSQDNITLCSEVGDLVETDQHQV